MSQSPVVHDYQGYLAYMRRHHWSNQNYEPPRHDRPTQYPTIVITDEDRSGRIFETYITLEDFGEEVVAD